MQLPVSGRLRATLIATGILAAVQCSALRCDHIRVDDVSFDLSKLEGPHSVVTSKKHTVSFTNTTYTLDICRPLKRKGQKKKGEECPNGTQVCAIEHLINGDQDVIEEVIPIAGNLKDWGGGDLDAKAERIKHSDSHADTDREGVRLVLNGGRYPLHGKHEKYQKAIIEFICDTNRTGLEGETNPEDQYEKSSSPLLFKKDDGNEKGGDGDGDGEDGEDDEEKQILQPDSALIWNSYGPGDKDNVDVLRLTWYTKYACEEAYGKPDDEEDGGGSSSGGWGFFTWLIIILFLGIAAYLIFGSWLNYNRYGARGWDLLPHGDTIRDAPYIMKDWARSVVNTVQSSGGRGGYSAL